MRSLLYSGLQAGISGHEHWCLLFYRKIYGSQRHPTIKEDKEFKEFKEVKKKLHELLKNPHLSQTVRTWLSNPILFCWCHG